MAACSPIVPFHVHRTLLRGQSSCWRHRRLICLAILATRPVLPRYRSTSFGKPAARNVRIALLSIVHPPHIPTMHIHCRPKSWGLFATAGLESGVRIQSDDHFPD